MNFVQECSTGCKMWLLLLHGPEITANNSEDIYSSEFKKRESRDDQVDDLLWQVISWRRHTKCVTRLKRVSIIYGNSSESSSNDFVCAKIVIQQLERWRRCSVLLFGAAVREPIELPQCTNCLRVAFSLSRLYLTNNLYYVRVPLWWQRTRIQTYATKKNSQTKNQYSRWDGEKRYSLYSL